MKRSINQNGIITPCKRYKFQIYNRNINKIDLKTNQCEQINCSNEIDIPSGLVLSKNNNVLYVTDRNNSNIIQICTKTGLISNLQIIGNLRRPSKIIISPNGKKLYLVDGGYVKSLCLLTHEIDTIYKNRWISNMLFSPDGKHLFIYSIHKIFKICLATNKCKTMLKVQGIRNIVISKNNQFLYISNFKNNSIYIINVESLKIENIYNPNEMFITKRFIVNYKDLISPTLCKVFETFTKSCLLKQSFLSINTIKQI